MKLNASIISVRRIGELGTTLAVLRLLGTVNVVHSSTILVTLMMVALSSPKRWFYKSHTA
jgi:hypothetical protein